MWVLSKESFEGFGNKVSDLKGKHWLDGSVWGHSNSFLLRTSSRTGNSDAFGQLNSHLLRGFAVKPWFGLGIDMHP